jgi:hypothetical protein
MDPINNKENITFFFEDTEIDELEDNGLELEQMLQNFDVEYDDTNANNIGDIGDISDDMKEMVYFIKKDFYCGNNEFYYNEEYKLKDLMKICQYYGIASSVKASKCKKQDVVSTIIYFEISPENYEMVEKRHKMWAYMTELLEDPKMRCYLLPPF